MRILLKFYKKWKHNGHIYLTLERELIFLEHTKRKESFENITLLGHTGGNR